MPYQHVDAPVTAEDLHGLIRAVELHCRRGMDRELGQIGLSMVQWQALRLVSRHPRIRQGRLARLTGHSGQAFAMLLARMVRYAFIARRADRGQPAVHELTRLGRILLPMANEIVADAEAQLFDTLDVSERAALKRLLRRVLHASSRPPWYNTG